MRNFKIITITSVLIILALALLWAIQGMIPSFGPSEDEIAGLYDELHNDEIDNDELYKNELKQMEGEIKLLGVSIYEEATHRLEEDDKLVVLLRSEKVNLEDYLNQRVKVQGIVKDTARGDQKIMTVSSLEKQGDIGTQRFDELTYEMNFSYPSEWEYSLEDDKVKFTIKQGGEDVTTVIVYQYEDEEVPLNVWLEDRDQNLIYEESQVSVGGQTGVRRTIKNGEEEIIKTYVMGGDNYYELRLVDQDSIVKGQYLELIDSFVSQGVVKEKSEEEGLEAIDKDKDAEGSEDAEGMEEEAVKDVEQPEEEENTQEEDMEENNEEKEEVVEEGQSFSSLTPLTVAEVENVINKGFNPFQGRTLSFDYPKIWYFAYLGDGQYGFTDHGTYTESNSEIIESNSRVLIFSGSESTSCSYKKTERVGGTDYTVCAREPGLKEIIDTIAGSLKKD